MISKDILEKIEFLLYDYNNFKYQIRDLELEIKSISIKAVNYDSINFGNSVSSSVENQIERCEKLKIKKELIEIRKMRVENLLEMLSKQDREFIKLKYFDRLTNVAISRLLYMHTNTVTRVNKKILKRLYDIGFKDLVLYV